MKIRIGGLDFEIILEKCGAKAGMTTSASGSHFYQDIKIDLDNRPLDGITADLWHEVIEMINGLHDLKLEHHTITTLGTEIYQVLRENKELLENFDHLIKLKKGDPNEKAQD